MSGSVPQTLVAEQYNLAEGIAVNMCSFQGFTTGTQAVTLIRGPGFKVVHTSTGVYTVTLSFIPGDSVRQTTTNNAGCVSEPQAYIMSETPATTTASVFTLSTTRVSTTGTFTISTFVSGSAADVTSADRVFFSYAWKSITGYAG